MSDVVSRWSAPGLIVRLVLLGTTGVAWTAISLQSALLHPDYWDPVTLSDWVSIWGYTATWLLTAVSLVIFREVARGDSVLRPAIAIVALACATTGVANALEDGLEVSGMGSVYVLGLLISLLGLLLVSAMTWAGATRRLAFVPLVGGLAAFTMVLGGGFLALVAWPGLGAALVRARRRGPTAA